ncbi:MAG: type I-F CRISPR-associated protein Csy1 [Pseudohongiellaceae bacterium]
MTSTVDARIDPDSIRETIKQFLQDRLQPKLDKLKEDETEKREKLLYDHQPENWIASAAKRAEQIQQVTHALKFTHPDAKGTSLNKPGNPEAGEVLVGTHTLVSVDQDVVGNAAALDVYKFLKLPIGDKTLLDFAIGGDSRLREAFSADRDQAQKWMTALARITQPKNRPASHALAKQLYWAVSDGEYHLLAPLFPTALVHHVVTAIREDRFSESAQSARNAYRRKEPYSYGFHEYPDLAIQHFGGTKPQNISQLNSERYGENYLLPSIPPTWQSEPVQPPLHVDSIFDRHISRRKRVRDLLSILRDFLSRVGPINNIKVRRTREDLMARLCDEVLFFAAELQTLEPGWTLDERCELNIDEQCWLDPERAAQDESFAVHFAQGDWKEGVSKRFANWVNARLTSSKTPMSEDEAREWRTVLDQEMNLIHTELNSND